MSFTLGHTPSFQFRVAGQKILTTLRKFRERPNLPRGSPGSIDSFERPGIAPLELLTTNRTYLARRVDVTRVREAFERILYVVRGFPSRDPVASYKHSFPLLLSKIVMDYNPPRRFRSEYGPEE